jgi:hypothetical protein
MESFNEESLKYWYLKLYFPVSVRILYDKIPMLPTTGNVWNTAVPVRWLSGLEYCFSPVSVFFRAGNGRNEREKSSFPAGSYRIRMPESSTRDVPQRYKFSGVRNGVHLAALIETEIEWSCEWRNKVKRYKIVGESFYFNSPQTTMIHKPNRLDHPKFEANDTIVSSNTVIW